MTSLVRALSVAMLLFVWNEKATALERASELTAIADLWKSPRSASCEALLRESYMKVAAALVGARFDDVRKIFTDSGNLAYTASDRSYCEVVLRRDVTFGEVGPNHELIAAVTKEHDGGAVCLDVLLRGIVNTTIGAVSERNFYPKGSLVAEILKLKHLNAKARKAPVLVRIDVAFGEIEEPESRQTGRGFTVLMQLSDKAVESPWAGAANVTYRALSGLDPIIDRITQEVTKPTGALFRATVLPPKRAITKPKAIPAIWVSVESD